MARKITVIGAGSVGATIAYTLAVENVAAEILMIDINKDKASGEALDIAQGASFFGSANVYDGDYSDATGSDIVVITSGLPRKPGQTRLELAQANVNIMKDIAPQITKYAPDAKYVIVSNPVDVLTYTFHKITNIPENRIIGSGTILDTSRLRATIASHYKINQKNVHACVLGEHGDSSFVPWSLATVAGVPVDQFGDFTEGREKIGAPDHEETVDFTKKSGGIIIKKKGATFYAIALSVVQICKYLFNDIESVASLSCLLHGEYGIDDVCLSLQCTVSEDGITGRLVPKMTDEEVALLKKSADALKAVINSVEI